MKTGELPRPQCVPPFKILYIINTGKKKCGKAIDRLLEIPNTHLTITVGRDAELKEKLARRAREYGGRVQILGWTNQMPQLMRTHHLVITKAGGATVQEAIAGRCPMILNQVLPGAGGGQRAVGGGSGGGGGGGKEPGSGGMGGQGVCGGGAALAALAGESGPKLPGRTRPSGWPNWRWANASWKGRPAAAHDFRRRPGPPGAPAPAAGPGEARMLLCDFHIHTNYSDGKLTVAEVVDFYGRRGFDCICITDHLADPRRLIGKLSRLANFTLGPEQLDEYFEVLDLEKRLGLRRPACR